jgi:hypothetical protein
MRIRGGFADLNPAGFFDNRITLRDPAGARICRATRQASQPPPPSLETVRAAEAELLARRKLQSERTTGTQAGERASFAARRLEPPPTGTEGHGGLLRAVSRRVYDH